MSTMAGDRLDLRDQAQSGSPRGIRPPGGDRPDRLRQAPSGLQGHRTLPSTIREARLRSIKRNYRLWETIDDKKKTQKKKVGFALMKREKLKEISSKGGKSVPPEKRIFAHNLDQAEICGRRSRKNVDPAKRTFAINPEIASEAGASVSLEKRREISRKGGIALREKRWKAMQDGSDPA